MSNYHYIIVSLPELSNDFSSQQFSYKEMIAFIREQLDERDNRLLDWIEYGFTQENLSHYFYHKAENSKNRFVAQYYALDRVIRNIQVSHLSKSNGVGGDKFILGGVDEDGAITKELSKILEMENIIEREQALDRYKWDKISEINLNHFFDIDVILEIVAKGKIVERWINMDQAKGAALFEQYVSEVRGTFKGINF